MSTVAHDRESVLRILVVVVLRAGGAIRVGDKISDIFQVHRNCAVRVKFGQQAFGTAGAARAP
jgi:hypothetical protein